MNMEATLVNFVVVVATGAALVKFALFEWEGVLRVWMRVSKSRKRRKASEGRLRRFFKFLPKEQRQEFLARAMAS